MMGASFTPTVSRNGPGAICHPLPLPILLARADRGAMADDGGLHLHSQHLAAHVRLARAERGAVANPITSQSSARDGCDYPCLSFLRALIGALEQMMVGPNFKPSVY
ncbi:unnamed protein product [Prorocentrum cordatum]|uniref:Uncharacterized protein n=1 Tax=Prorocentrum cordatum TaxID=2364126 RepID=A0ABN9SUC9_9DINO|nr:unnamed protein product [Polarella glacialis]